LALSVVFAMLASYLLSRTLIPTMVHYLLKTEVLLYQHGEHGESAGGKGLIWRAHYAFNHRFERFRMWYTGLLDWALEHRAPVLIAFGVFCVGSLGLGFLVGRDFFPNVDSGQMRFHVRPPTGTRLESAEVRFAAIEEEIRHVIPPEEIDTIIDNIGIPNSTFNLAFGDSATISNGDGDILVSLKPEKHGSIADYTVALRKRLNEKFTDCTFFWEAANITNQILNFGLPAPIDLQVIGRDAPGNYRIAQKLAASIKRIPGAADVHIHQIVDYPEFRLNVDRTKAAQLGLTQRDVTNGMLISLSSSGQVAPNQWLNQVNGVNYQVAVQTPQYKLDSLAALLRTPVSNGLPSGPGTDGSSLAYGNPNAGAGSTQLLSNLVSVGRGFAPGIVSHYNVQPVFDIYANVDRTDLGSVGSAVEKIMKEEKPKLPTGTTMTLRGQVTTMESSFVRLGLGMLAASILVYLLMAVNFQSWVDPFIILTALPGALAGILWMLFVTQTTLSVPSLMGAIMCIGVATANSILMVVFANDQREEGKNAREAALAAGYTRVRPVLMTASAMLLGMLPMALGLGEGGEQNAPLGRAVIGGLSLATVTTLFVVPIIYSYLRTKPPIDHEKQIEEEEREGAPESELYFA
jgi:multidrug efflux pump subunit AcrB